MRKDNRKVLSPSGLLLICNARSTPILSFSGLTRESSQTNLPCLSLDPRVKPEGDSGGDESVPEGDSRKKVPEWDSVVKEGYSEWKWGGAAAVAAISVVFCLGTGEALAQCAVPPSCESLGYDKTVADCGNRPIIKCPFDTAKVYCGVYVDPEGRVFGKVGDYYYSDGTMSESIISSKTIIGVVGIVADNGKHGRIISLSQSGLQWSRPKYNDVVCLGNLDGYEASMDMDGFQNTKCLLSQTGTETETYPAAEYCHNYKAAASGVGSTGWYFPAPGELVALKNGYKVINESLSKLSKTPLSKSQYWSSAEVGTVSAWYVNPYDGSMGSYIKYDRTYLVRCMLEF